VRRQRGRGSGTDDGDVADAPGGDGMADDTRRSTANLGMTSTCSIAPSRGERRRLEVVSGVDASGDDGGLVLLWI
jgi:hypothetical protein